MTLFASVLAAAALAATSAAPPGDAWAQSSLMLAFRDARASNVFDGHPPSYTTPAGRLAAHLSKIQPELRFVAGGQATARKDKPLTIVVDTHTTASRLILWIKAQGTRHIFRLTASSAGAPIIVRVR